VRSRVQISPSRPSQTYRRMFSLTPGSRTKLGSILYGLIAGTSVLVGVILASFVLGAFASLVFNLMRINPGGYAVGAFVCWKIWKSRLGRIEQ
jgi:hypothetical protein